MKIAGDKNQFTGSHAKSNANLHKQIVEMGHELLPVALPYGDYVQVTEQMQETIDRRGSKLKKADLVGDIKISVDRKNSIDELCGNICGKQHARFRDELILAQKCGCQLYIMVENREGIRETRDLFRWRNPRAYRYYKIRKAHEYGRMMDVPLPKAPPTDGQTLAKAVLTMELKYGVKMVYVSPEEAGKKLVELLSRQ